MRISSYLCPWCSVLAAHFSNLTRVECSHRRDAETYTHGIFHNNCKRPHHATWKLSNLYIENKYHDLTLHKKIPITFVQGSKHFDSKVRSQNDYTGTAFQRKWETFLQLVKNLTTYNIKLADAHFIEEKGRFDIIWHKKYMN